MSCEHDIARRSPIRVAAITKGLCLSLKIHADQYSETEPSKLSDAVETLTASAAVFYGRNRASILSIMLSGSLARKRTGIFNDADIYAITRFSYDLLTGKRLERFLQKRLPEIKIDVGVCPISRLTSHLDKSHYLYDLKYNSLVLAGIDYRHQIPEISVNDFYPFEGFLIILNRAVDLIRSVKIFEPERIVLDVSMFKTAVRRIQRAYVDSVLIFDGIYHQDYDERLLIFKSLHGKLPEPKTFNEARILVVEALHQGIRELGISYESLLHRLENRYLYPRVFRLYTFLNTRKPNALVRNPLFDVYKHLIRFFEFGKLESVDWASFQREVIDVFDKSSRPCLVKCNENN